MSSPTPEMIAAKAELARRRAARSRAGAKLALALGLLVFLGFVGQSLWRPAVVKPPEPVPSDKPKQIAGMESRFSGLDQNSRPFTVTAQQGVQDPNNDSLMHLGTVVGTFARRDGGDVQVTADKADYDIRTKDLAVTGKVRFEEPGRYVAHLNSATVNLDHQAIVSKEPVQVETAGASVSADSMETSDDGRVVKLKGNVKAHFKSDITE